MNVDDECSTKQDGWQTQDLFIQKATEDITLPLRPLVERNCKPLGTPLLEVLNHPSIKLTQTD